MHNLKILTLALAVILLPALSWASLNGFARISLLQGDVQVRSEDNSEWFPASVNTPLQEGDSVWCPAGSRAEIQLKNGTFIRLDQQTSLDVLALADDSLQFHLGMGHAYFRTGDMRGAGFQLDLNESSAMVYDKGRFRIDLSADGDEDISIIKGSAYVESNGQKTRVRAGEMLSVVEGNPEILPLNPPDEWERWNVERDRRYFAKGSGTRYLPEELVIYERDLNDNGEWIYDRSYGNVWRPTVIDAPDWSPYRVGRWVWRGDDYVWISYENWGWAPYHYGRWINLPSRGWCWVPPARGEAYWSPGYVGWVTTGSYVGWVPLAPGEIYYGRGYYGRNSVNITNVNVRNITVNQVVYKNVNVNKAVTVVNRTSFASGVMNYVKPRENIFVQGKIQLGRPDIKPGNQAMMPVVRTISPVKLPPPGIRNIPLQDLRRRHPRIEGNPLTFTENKGNLRQNGKQDRTVIPRQPVAGSVPAVGGNRSLGEKPSSRPEGIAYPGNQLHNPDRQKAKAPTPVPAIGKDEKNGQNPVKTVTSGPGNAAQAPNYRDMRQNGKQDQRVIPRQPVVQQPVAGAVPAVGYNRSLGEKPVSRPEIINYPNGRPQTIDRQKPKVLEPEKRLNERTPPVQVRTVSPEPVKAAEPSVRRNTGINPPGVPQRQQVQTPGPGKPIDSQPPASGGSATSWPAKKNDRPASLQKDGDHGANIPQRVLRQGGNPTQPQPVVTPKTREKSTTPPATGNNRKVWQVKEPENPATEVRTDGKPQEKGYVKPVRP